MYCKMSTTFSSKLNNMRLLYIDYNMSEVMIYLSILCVRVYMSGFYFFDYLLLRHLLKIIGYYRSLEQ